MKKIIVCAASLLLLCGCTDSYRTRALGGQMTKNLPSNTKLVNVTWKNSELWILTRPMETNESPITYSFKEISQYGVLEGEVKIVESR